VARAGFWIMGEYTCAAPFGHCNCLRPQSTRSRARRRHGHDATVANAITSLAGLIRYLANNRNPAAPYLQQHCALIPRPHRVCPHAPAMITDPPIAGRRQLVWLKAQFKQKRRCRNLCIIQVRQEFRV
jgi:hypothetical protein